VGVVAVGGFAEGRWRMLRKRTRGGWRGAGAGAQKREGEAQVSSECERRGHNVTKQDMSGCVATTAQCSVYSHTSKRFGQLEGTSACAAIDIPA